MVLYPDVQAQAQGEIDAIVGNGRLPTVEDREKLPFISALAMEVLRWHVVGPTGMPHRAMEDDVHDGYLIPKGALIIPNIWYVPSRALHHAESKVHRNVLSQEDGPRPRCLPRTHGIQPRKVR